MSWKVIQTRWIRGSNQNFSTDLAEFGRKKQAFGEVKHQLTSHGEMLIKHEAWQDYGHDMVIDDNSITFFWHDGEPIYHIRFEAIEVDPEPKVPKINLIFELEQILFEHKYCMESFFYEECYCMQDVKRLVNQVKERSASRG